MKKGYEMVIGLEVHCELKTETKIFCSCPKMCIRDRDNPLCDGFNILHIVRGEDDGNAAVVVDFADEFPYGNFGDSVKTNGRLIQKEDFWSMDKRRGDLTTHPLPQRKLACGGTENGTDL